MQKEKTRFDILSQRVDKPIDTLQMLNKEGIFCEIVFVAVRWYCREQFRKKQATARKTRCFPCRFYHLHLRMSADAYPYKHPILFSMLAVDRLFRQSEDKI